MPNIVNNYTFAHYVIEKALNSFSVSGVGENIFAAIVGGVDFLFSLFYVLFL